MPLIVLPRHSHLLSSKIEPTSFQLNMSHSNLKTYKKFPVHIVEYHNQVLPHIYRAIGSKYLPFKNIALIHFDSHPDLGISFDLKAQDVFDKEKLFQSIEIESWILPAMYAGHVSTVVWCKPPWATQIANGYHEFFVGKDPKTQTIRVSSTDPYFLSDCLNVDEALLQERKLVQLHVVTIKSEEKIILTDLINKDQNYILDIDLDFYSTRNPFREMFSSEDLNTLTKLYWFEPPPRCQPEDIKKCQEMRQSQLNQLKEWIASIKNGNNDTGDDRFIALRRILNNYQESLGRKLDEEDLEINNIKLASYLHTLTTRGLPLKKLAQKWTFHGAGCATDDPELPHHVSTKKEIVEMVQQTRALLELNSHPPVLVTIARSSVDDYCPASQVDEIQVKIEELMKSLYSPVDFYHHFEND